MTLLALESVIDKPVRQLSLGERMRCELVAALLHQPDILFLDEPTLGLDITGQAAIRDFLRAYRDRHGATVLLTSHYMADVTALASRVLIMNHGHLLYDGQLDTLAARLAPVKRLALVLGEGVGRDDLQRFGSVRRLEFPYATLEIPRTDAAAISAALLAALPVIDFSIEDPPIEEVIQQAFAEPSLQFPEGAMPTPPGHFM